MTASSKATYTLDGLADALLYARRYKRAADELRSYYVPRGKAFRRAFGLASERDLEASDRRYYLRHLLDRTLRSMLSFSSPTSGYLEAPRELFEFASRFQPEIDRASAELQRVLRTMLIALLEELVTRKTVTADDLKAHGFDAAKAAPDPDDFW
jgi:hypothetical protein